MSTQEIIWEKTKDGLSLKWEHLPFSHFSILLWKGICIKVNIKIECRKYYHDGLITNIRIIIKSRLYKHQTSFQYGKLERKWVLPHGLDELRISAGGKQVLLTEKYRFRSPHFEPDFKILHSAVYEPDFYRLTEPPAGEYHVVISVTTQAGFKSNCIAYFEKEDLIISEWLMKNYQTKEAYLILNTEAINSLRSALGCKAGSNDDLLAFLKSYFSGKETFKKIKDLLDFNNIKYDIDVMTLITHLICISILA